jgi:ABC-type transport system substrate-binding protein
VAGDIDVLDHVPSWHLERLRAAQGVRVESYRLPTVHVLLPNLQRPLLAKREFRRALSFGIDRQWIVERVLLGGESAPGFEVLSGPFPAGASLSDPVRYGYNNQITPRPFEPRLAAILATVAWSNVQSAASNDESDEEQVASADIPQLTLAHPADPVARLACQSIQAQLQRQGIPIKLSEFTADELLAGRVDYDLRYAELAVWEPVTDARRLLGPGSLTGDLQSPYLDAALRQLDEASNWNDVRARLAEVHEIAHHDLPVIPLWQTINYFAYRTSVRGIGESPMTLYQNADEWSPATASNVARLDQAAP